MCDCVYHDIFNDNDCHLTNLQTVAEVRVCRDGLGMKLDGGSAAGPMAV